VQRGLDYMLKEKAFGGLDYAVFFEGAKKSITEELTESYARIEKNNGGKVCQ